ncbi:MAG: primosomal protein N' [Planctomycetaceae bacterium]
MQSSLFGDEPAPAAPMPWEQAAEQDLLAAQVVLNKPLSTVYTYLIPDELRDLVGPGQRVRVPFGRGDRSEAGYVVAVGPPEPTSRKLKSVAAVVDREPLVSPKMLRLTQWIADYYLCGWGQVLHGVVPAGVKKQSGTRLLTYFRPTESGRQAYEALSLSKKQRAVMEVLVASTDPLRGEEITGAADCGPGPINSLKQKGYVEAVRLREETTGYESEPVVSEDDFVPNEEQKNALEGIHAVLRSGRHETILLHGVTGSGKTEVYIQAIREAVSYGRQAIVLVPEISLTPQTIRRFRTRFDSVAVLHSHLSDSERHWHWTQIAAGKVQVVVGARSAVFAPCPHLGLIIIDEEHETTFKQETVPRYHARDVARERARIEGVPLILGSATPMLESWHRVLTGQDRLISLHKRVGKLPLPPVVVVDVRNDPHVRKGSAIGRALGSAMRLALEDGGQVILFLNLRGFSPAIWCPACGASVKCRDCDITMTWHKDKRKSICHSCGIEEEVPRTCPSCGNNAMRYVGTGTQKLEEEVRAKFPDISCARMDSDAMKKPGSHDAVLTAFREGDVRILLGTQMIAKGLDFPNVTLVGVVDADTLLHQPDLRASERTFQLIAQVAGRTGRSSRGGRVFVQSSSPSEPAIRRASEHDYLGFVTDEMRDREAMGVPPFRSLARVILRGDDETAVRTHALEMAGLFEKFAAAKGLSIEILGPAPAPIAKLKGQYRFHFQLSAETLEPIRELWRIVEKDLPAAAGVEYVVDVDPVNMR